MKQFIVLISLGILLVACSKKKTDPFDCQNISDKNVLLEEDLSSYCWYNKVFTYDTETYTVCECCSCLKAPMAIDCNGNQLCDWGIDCMKDFFERAELVGYVEFE